MISTQKEAMKEKLTAALLRPVKVVDIVANVVLDITNVVQMASHNIAVTNDCDGLLGHG